MVHAQSAYGNATQLLSIFLMFDEPHTHLGSESSKSLFRSFQQLMNGGSPGVLAHYWQIKVRSEQRSATGY